MTPESIQFYIVETFADIVPKDRWGETSFFVNPEGRFAHGAYFATIKRKDGENDSASGLDRDGVWRLNFGLTPSSFKSLFGPRPARPAKGRTIEGDWDFTALDTLTPHPVYGWMGWVSVNCLSASTFESCKPLLQDAYGKAVATLQRRMTNKASA